MSVPLPPTPDLQHLKKQAKDLLKARQAEDPQALATLREHLPRLARDEDAPVALHDAQTAIARQYGFASWADLRAAVGEADPAEPSRTRAPSFDSLDDKLRRHIDTLGFHSVGAYRRWCHEQGFGIALDKSDGDLYEELARRQQEPPTPVLRRDYRPSEARKITQAYRGETEGVWEGYQGPFEGVDDPEERSALHRLLIHCLKYAPIGGPPVWELARHHEDWLRPVEEWIPKGRNERELIVELTGFLLGKDHLPSSTQTRRQESPSECFARVRQRRDTVLRLEDVDHFMERGWLRLPEAFPRETALQMQAFMWAHLERMHGFRQDEPGSWRLQGWSPDKPPYNWTTLRLNRCKDDPIWKELATPRMVAAIEELMSAHAASLTQSWGAFVPRFPTQDPATPWDLPTRWSCYGSPDGGWTMRTRTLYSEVTPRGGATLVVEGSHRLLRQYFESLPTSERVGHGQRHSQRFLQRHDYLAELTGKAADRGERVRRFMEETTVVDGVPLRVIELTGQPGDVFFTLPMVAAASRNLTKTPVFTRG